nr:hypothetical protein GCM10020092_053740 [Actinoplanes digitatis]
MHLTGHGERGQSGTHRLIMPGGDPRRPDRDAYPTGDLISAALSSDASQVLIIVNACYAKAVQADVLRVAQDLPRHRREHATLAVIATVDADDRPRDREFATLLDRVHAQLCTTAGIAAEHLTLEEFLTELTRAALQDPGQPLAVPHRVWETWRTRYPMRSLPNPGYRPPADLAGPQRRQVAADATELDYWLDRASGRPDHDPGWYFTGRADLNRATARFLTGDGGVLIVTGSAGSGKSAVIARAVTLSDPDVLARPRYARAAQAAPPGTLPPPGAVDVALLARNTDSVDLLTRLVTALGEQPRPAPDHGDPGQHLREQITEIISARFAGTGRPVTVVVDGLDEATRPTRLVADLLGPLARLATPAGVHLVRLLVGVRSSTPHHALPAAEFDTLLDLLQRATAAPPGNVLRTDTDGVYDDLATYAETLLAAGDGPYAGDDEAVRAARTETAAVIAARVQPSFLDTRLAARPPPWLSSPASLSTTPHGWPPSPTRPSANSASTCATTPPTTTLSHTSPAYSAPPRSRSAPVFPGPTSGPP